MGIPEGYALVPIEPSEAMMERAAFNLCGEYGVEYVKALGRFTKDAYAELIAAAPQPVTDDGHSFERP